MNTTEQALKVRHAFENIRNNYVGWQDNPNFKVLEEALAALSQSAQKPSAWKVLDASGIEPLCTVYSLEAKRPFTDRGYKVVELFEGAAPQPSAPVAQAERHVLTDDVIVDAVHKALGTGSVFLTYTDDRDGGKQKPTNVAKSFARAILSTAPQVEQVEAKEVQTQDAAINDFVEGYEIDSGEGIYIPTEHERFLINDAIRTFLADQGWYMTAAPASQKEGEQ